MTMKTVRRHFRLLIATNPLTVKCAKMCNIRPTRCILCLSGLLLIFPSILFWSKSNKVRLKHSNPEAKIPSDSEKNPIGRQRYKFSDLKPNEFGHYQFIHPGKYAAFYAAQGPRPTMEDRFDFFEANLDTLTDLNNNEIIKESKTINLPTIFAVYDGHGGSIISNEILSFDQKIVKENQSEFDYQGSTIILAILYPKKLLTLANVGDSRAVVSDSNGNFLQATVDHKPDHPVEKSRIERSGGFIQHFGVWRVNGFLALSRAIGDLWLKRPRHLIAEPDFYHFDLRPENEARPNFIILASDGLWDVVNNSEAVSVVNQAIKEGNDPLIGTKSLVEMALKRFTMDNVAVLVVKLR